MKQRIVFILILFIFSLNSNAVIADTTPEDRFDKWKSKLNKDATAKGYSEDFLKEVFEEISYSDEYITHDQKQFKPQTFEEYYKNAVNRSRVKKVKKQMKENEEILNKIEEDFMVPKQYIIALWAIETDFGRIAGNYNVFHSLANLSFDERRRGLFLAEFMAALEVIKVNEIKAKDFKGSWAGAIGQCQFLPSTYLNHGFDFNKDQKTDIWETQEDVFASIANYLQNLGWKKEVPWGYELENNNKDLGNIKESHSLQYLVSKYGVRKKDESGFTESELLSSVKVVIQEDRLFITFKNFDLIRKWNNSTYFALTVGLLSDVAASES